MNFIIRFIKDYRWIATWIIAVMAVVVFFVEPGFLTKPKVSISCGAIDIKIPAKLQMELGMMKMMTLSEELQKTIFKEFKSILEEQGLSNPKIDLIVKSMNNKTGKDIKEDITLLPHEENIIKMALAKSVSHISSNLTKSLNMPDAVLFFEITNTGWTGAKNVHIIIKVDGVPYNVIVDSDNKLIEKNIESSPLSLDYVTLAPNSKTKGIIWFNFIDSKRTIVGNEIVVSFDQGTVRQEFSVDEFYLVKN
jgi:hypothetical protein